MIKALYRFLHPRFQNLFLEYKVNFRPRYGRGKPPHAELYRIIDAQRDTYRGILREALSLKEAMWTIKDSSKEADPTQPCLEERILAGPGYYRHLYHSGPV